MERDKALAAWEIVSVVVSCLIGEWFVLSFLGRQRWAVVIPVGLALMLMVVSHQAYQENLKQLGFRFDNFFPACRMLVIPTVVIVLAVLLIAWLTAGSVSIKLLRARFLLLPLWALFQQYVLQAFINRRAQVIWGKGVTSILVVGLIFGALHLPNLMLAGITFAGGAVLAAVYQRYPNLFALALAHSLVSLFVNTASSLRVGFKFFG